MSKYESWNIGGQTIKMDDRYTVKDNAELKNLILSSTQLHPNKSTSGHTHAGQEEVYIFVEGSGTMEVDEDKFEVTQGDIVTIPDGAYHRVHSSDLGCYFVCVFDGDRKH